MRGNDIVDSSVFFPRVECSNIREHSFNVRVGKFKRDLRSKFFLCRVAGACNALPGKVVVADTIATFIRHLGRNMNRRGIKVTCRHHGWHVHCGGKWSVPVLF